MLMLLKKIGIHVSVMVAMCLSLYLCKGMLLPLKLEAVRLLVAMIIGAWAAKPLSDLVCRKIL